MNNAIILISIGLIFDLLSFFFGLMGIIEKRHVSGFPIIGLICYALGVFVSFNESDGLFGFSIFYGIVMLVGIHVFFQLPLLIQQNLNNKP